MDKEAAVSIHKIILCSCNKKENYAVHFNIDKTEGHYVKQSKSENKRQKYSMISLIFRI